MTKLWRLLGVIPLALLLTGCGGEDDDPCLDPTFTSIHGERLSQSCATAFCHDAQTASGGQNYSAAKNAVHAALLGDTTNAVGAPMYPKLVVPGQPDMSFLWIKVSRDDAPGGRMPLGGAPMAQCDLDAIRTWITNGAAND